MRKNKKLQKLSDILYRAPLNKKREALIDYCKAVVEEKEKGRLSTWEAGYLITGAILYHEPPKTREFEQMFEISGDLELPVRVSQYKDKKKAWEKIVKLVKHLEINSAKRNQMKIPELQKLSDFIHKESTLGQRPLALQEYCIAVATEQKKDRLTIQEAAFLITDAVLYNDGYNTKKLERILDLSSDLELPISHSRYKNKEEVWEKLVKMTSKFKASKA